MSLGAPSPANTAWLSNNSVAFINIERSDYILANFEKSSFEITEGSPTTTITATLSAPFSETVTIPFTFSQETGNYPAGRNTLSANSFVFPKDSTSASVQLTVTNDESSQSTQNLSLFLGTPSSPFVIADKSPRMNIKVIDDDRPVLRFESPYNLRSTIESVGSVRIVATLDRVVSSPTRIPIVVSGTTEIGELATFGQGNDFTLDFPRTDGRELVFGTNESSTYFDVLINNDRKVERTESIRFGVSPSTYGNSIDLSSNPTATLLIEDNDPLVSILAIDRGGNVAPSGEITEFDGTANFMVVLTTLDANGVEVPTRANVDAVLDIVYFGTAEKSSGSSLNDYTVGPSRVTIPRGQSSVLIPVLIHNDTRRENNKTISLRLQNLVNAVFRRNKSGEVATLTVIDDEGLPSVSYATPRNLSVSERNQPATVSVRMNQKSSRDVFVTLEFSGAAKRDYDYRVTGTEESDRSVLKIPANQLTASFSIQTIDDPYTTDNESITIKLLRAVNAIVPPNPSLVSIEVIDDETNVVATQSAGSLIISTDVSIPQRDPKYGTQSPNQSTVIPPTPQQNWPTGTGGLFALGGASAGLLSQSSVFFDSNFNGIRDFLDLGAADGIQSSDEPDEAQVMTLVDGSFHLFLPPEFDKDGDGYISTLDGRLVATGGFDTSTGLAWGTKLTAPVGSFAITPLTTLADSLVRKHGLSTAAAFDQIVTAFKIEGYDIAGSRGLYEIIATDALAAKAYVASVQVYSSVIQLAELFAGVSGGELTVDELADNLYDIIADQITTSDGGFDFGYEGTIESLIFSLSNRIGIDINSVIASGAAQVIAAGARAVSAPDINNYASGLDFANDVIKAKKISQGEAGTALRQVGEGTRTIQSVVADYTGSAFDSKINSATVEVVIPPVIAINDVIVTEGDNGTQMLQFAVAIVGPHNYAVSVDFATFDALEFAALPTLLRRSNLRIRQRNFAS